MTTPEPDQYARAWDRMRERAVNILRTGEMENGIDPLDLNSEEGQMLSAGVSIGIAAAAQHYKEHPEDIPPQEDPHGP